MGVEEHFYFAHSTKDLRYQTESRHLPRLLCSCDRPLVATPVRRCVVRARERLQVTDDGIGDHDDEGQHPCGSNHPIGVRTGLPHSWLQGVTDGAVALNRYSNQAKSGDAHGYACRKAKQVIWKVGEIRTAVCLLSSILWRLLFYCINFYYCSVAEKSSEPWWK